MQTRLVLVVAVNASTIACIEPAGPAPEEVGSASAPIINGVLDTSHDAVVTLSPVGCSATIVKTDPALGVGYVLTAAHCLDGSLPTGVRLGEDLNDPDIIYPVTGTSVHPLWGTAGYENDFAVVRISGVDATTPVIPAAFNGDGAYANASVTSVGFGQIFKPSEPPVFNSERHRLDTQLVTAFTSAVNYSGRDDTGICFGDSGGPVLGIVAGVEHVIGVHSNTSPDCEGGSSGRVSFVGAWLAAELDEPAPLGCAFASEDAACATCVQGSCCTESTACFADVNCVNCAMGHVAPDDCGVLSPAYVDLIACLGGCATDPCADVPPWSGIPPETTTSSTTSASTTGAGTTTSSGGGGEGKGGDHGLGGSNASGGNDAAGGDDDSDGGPDDSGCAVRPLPARGGAAGFTAMALGAAIAMRTRRNRDRRSV